ncbi:MAG: hypothetical protein WC812_01855 [Candidatus Pacearchaeota archaeon]|jgi:hypothetical protein
MANYCPKENQNCEYALYIGGKYSGCCSSLGCETQRQIGEKTPLSKLEKDISRLQQSLKEIKS